MLFKIQNLGAVKEAEIDLSKDLILLCGHNNTGKTYVAYAIYDFLKIYRDMLYFAIEDKLDIGNGRIQIFENKNISNVILKEFESIGKLLLDKEKVIININDLDSVFKAIQNHFFYQIEMDLKNLFGISEKTKFIKKAKFSLSLYPFNTTLIDKIRSNEWFYEVDDSIHHHLNMIILQKVKYSEEIIFSLNKNHSSFENREHLLIGILQDFVFLITSLIYSSVLKISIYFFPAERSAINIFSKELSLIENKIWKDATKDDSLKKLAERRLYRYPQPIRDSLELSQDLETLAKTISPFAHLADELEQAILRGKISVGQYGDLRYSPAESPDLKLEMHVSSSLVKSLASISFYLRHIAQKGDCIIIDEPELNLHPDNQILVARFLARLVNEGFKVIASTHSDYIIRELNNLILLNNDFPEKKSLIEKYKYQENQLLSAEKVGAYIFKDGYGKEVPLSNQGIEIQSIDTVIADLNQRSDDIYYSYSDSLPQEDK